MLEKILKSPLDCKEIKPVNPKGNQPWIFIGRAEAKALILWPPDVKSLLIGKVPDARKDWGQEEKRATEHEMVGYHHWLNGHEFEITPGDSERQWNLACYSLGSQRVRHNWATEQSKMVLCVTGLTLLNFQIKTLFLAPALPFLIYWPVLQWGVWAWTW